MFHLWHLTAILGVFVIGFFAGRLSMRYYLNVKIEELESRVESERLAKEREGMEWAARRH